MVLKRFASKGVGLELAAVLPKDAPPWYKQSHLVKLNFTLLCLILFSSANGYDGSMMNGLQALPQWQEFMGVPTGPWLGFVNAVQSLGALCLYPVVAWSNNRFGRKKTIGVGYFWLALGAGLGAGAKNPAMFVIGRLCIGGTSAFYSASAPLLITETAYPTHRSVVTALFSKDS
jgi:MFS family permease